MKTEILWLMIVALLGFVAYLVMRPAKVVVVEDRWWDYPFWYGGGGPWYGGHRWYRGGWRGGWHGGGGHGGFHH